MSSESSMEMEAALAFVRKEAAQSGAEQFDLVGHQSSSLSLSAFAGKVQQTEISESVGVGIRIFQNGSPGYASTERLTQNSLRQTLRDALSHCAFTQAVPIVLPTPTEVPSLPTRWNPDLESLGLSEIAKFCLDLEQAVFARSSEIENVPHLGYGLSREQSWLLNSKGIYHSERENAFGVGIGAVGLRNGVRKMGVYQRAGRDRSMATVEGMANMVVERSLELLDAMPIVGSTMPVVFSNRISASIIGLYLSSFHAELVQKGQSRLADKIGKRIAVPEFHLVSDPTRTDLPGAAVLDDEGVPTQRLDVVAGGELRSFLHNLETAGRAHCTSTGHGARGFSGKVGTTFHNALVLPGLRSEEELLHLFPRCLHIVKLEGSSGCSAISGELSIGAQGFLVEKGERVHAVDGITLSTNFFDLLEHIVGIGNEYNDSFSSLKVPALAVTDVAVSA